MAGPSPTPDLLDPLGLFSHGEFRRYDTNCPELNLATHGEFPRAGAVVLDRAPGSAAKAGVGNARRRQRRYKPPEPVKIPQALDLIALALLAADEDDDWW